MQKLRSSTRPESEVSMQLWEELLCFCINSAWESFKENIATSAEESLRHYDIEQHIVF